MSSRTTLIAAALLGAGFVLAAQTQAGAKVGGAVLGVLTGQSVRLSGSDATAPNTPGRWQLTDGARIALAGSAAQVALTRGGGLRLCGPARLSLAAGGHGALLLSLAQGALELRYPSAVADSLLTPDFRVDSVVPPQQLAAVSASVSLAANGTLCVLNRGSALSVERLFDGAQTYVINGQALQFHPAGGAPTVVASCPCAAALPAAVPPAPATGVAGNLFPAEPALTANAGRPLTSPAPPPPQPPSAKPHHNFLVRFLLWLF